jgi:fructose-1,6-bisphosphatase/inositol monophosphatase family enzyme
MDLAYTAMGAFDIWWEGGCWEWYVPGDPIPDRMYADKTQGMLLLALLSSKKPEA